METIPEGWMKQRIDDFLEKMVDPVKPEPDRMYREIGIRSHAKGIFHKEQVTGKSLGSKRVFKIHADCFVVNIVFAWEQAIALTSDEELGMIASHRFPMFRPKENRCDVNYITYYFKTPHGKYLLGLASPGGAGRNKTLGQSEFARLELILPPQQEQKKIAKILSVWELAIEVTEKLLKNSQQQKKSLMQQLLTGKKHLPGFSGEWKDWHLNEVATIIVSPVDKKIVEGEIPVELCNYTDVYYNIEITRSLNFMKATAKQAEIDKYVLKVGDVIITKDSETPGDIAVPAFVSEDLKGTVCGYHLAIVRPNKKLADGSYLNNFFSMPKTRYYFFTLANGATRFGLSVGGIQKAHFHLPPLEEQQKISSVLSTADKEIENLQQNLDCLRQEKKALMQQLLTGKRRVTL
jgi:type I restriction enzyme S subunit